MCKVQQRLRSITLIAALEQWRSEVEWSRHLRHMDLQASVHLERSTYRRVFRAWGSLVRGKQRARLAVLMQSTSRSQRDELEAAFGQWRTNVVELRRQERMHVRAVAQMQRRTLSASFMHFRRVVWGRKHCNRVVKVFRTRARRRLVAEVSDSATMPCCSLKQN
jgi:hypothetical protein